MVGQTVGDKVAYWVFYMDYRKVEKRVEWMADSEVALRVSQTVVSKAVWKVAIVAVKMVV